MLLRAGAGVVPVTLTLASRPVRAWHCNTSSAWGSAQVSPNASTTARNKMFELENETWTIYNWKSNTTRAGLAFPWEKVRSKWSWNSVDRAQKKFTVSQLFGFGIPAGLLGSDKVFKLLNDQNNDGQPRTVTDFQKYMIVAQLNAMFIPNVAACLKTADGVDQLPQMIDGIYQPSNIDTSGPWDSTTIMRYLRENWIVRP